MTTHRPSWFRDDAVFVSFAPTVGINKDGDDLYVIDAAAGLRTALIDDELAKDVAELVERRRETDTSRWVTTADLTSRLIGVPVYYDTRSVREFDVFMKRPQMHGFEAITLGALLTGGQLVGRAGHGSPPADFRTGRIPYIKVSDIRAGQLNINPTNRVSEVTAHKYWKGTNSGIQAFDLVTPVRTSKNIGDFAIVMPGQERVVLTKEVLVLRAGDRANFDNFYLLWAMTLEVVRRQWNRIVFMQTNREDVGSRYLEVQIPVSPDRELNSQISAPFRDYYLGVQEHRQRFLRFLENDRQHHVFLAGSEAE